MDLIPLPSHNYNWGGNSKEWQDLLVRLFRSLQDALARRLPIDFAAQYARLDQWLPFVGGASGEEEAKRSRQWATARRMLWSFEQASTSAPPDSTHIGRVCFTLADTPEFIKGHEAWTLDCIRALRRGGAGGTLLRVPVALSDEILRSTGAIATLDLEVLEPGGGQVFPHPKDSLRTHPHVDFEASMQQAWTAAKTLVRRDAPDILRDGRWRLEMGGHPVSEVSGRSASGAAAWGWWFALQGKMPDAELIVIAQIDAEGVLSGVDPRGIGPKVQAIACDDRFDTIVGADAGNQAEGVEALVEVHRSGIGKSHSIRIVDLHSRKFELVDLRTGSVSDGDLDARDA